METIYLLIRQGIDDQTFVLGGYSSKEKAEAARQKYAYENTYNNLSGIVDRWLEIKPCRFDKAPSPEICL